MPASKCDCGCGHRPAAAGNKMRPLVCNSCGCTARYTRQWLARMPAVPACPVCGVPMDAPCLYDLLLVSEERAQHHELYARLVLGIVQKDLRKNGVGRTNLQCGGCRTFIGALNHLCQCGFQNDIRGGRNSGHYVEGAAYIPTNRERRTRDAIPF